MMQMDLQNSLTDLENEFLAVGGGGGMREEKDN